MPDHTRYKAVSDFGRPLLSEQLEANIVAWNAWCMLGVGGFFNVTIPSSGAYGGDQHRLGPVSDRYYADGAVWQGFRGEWVWETGVDYARQPIRVSGVYVDGDFYPTASTTGAYAHTVNYPLGRVVFDTPVPASSVVEAEYSYRWVTFYPADVPWFRQVQQGSLRVDDPHFAQAGSGEWAVLAQNRVQLPAVVVQVTTNSSRAGYEIGNSKAVVKQEVRLHVFAETPWERHRLHDVLTTQWQKRILLFDLNRMEDESAFPLDANGSPASGAKMYPQLVRPSGEGGYAWEQLRFDDFRGSQLPDQSTSELYVATVRGTFEVDWY